jgi:cyanate permease
VFWLQVFRAALLSCGGIAGTVAVGLSYEGDHKVVTILIWALFSVLLLAAGVYCWCLIHRRQEDETTGRTGIDNAGEMELDEVSLGHQLQTGLKNRRGGKFKGRRVDAD